MKSSLLCMNLLGDDRTPAAFSYTSTFGRTSLKHHYVPYEEASDWLGNTKACDRAAFVSEYLSVVI